jgi:phage tail sheath protein FI
VDGTEVTITRQEAQTLSDNGLVTAFRTGGGTGFVLWNNNTAAFPSTTDVKDRFIPNSRMATHIANTIILSVFQKVDDPVNRRLISSVVTSLNQAFSGREAQGALLGATVQFLEQDNPITDLQNGSITFRLFYAAPTPANEIEVVLEVDVDQYKALFQ